MSTSYSQLDGQGYLDDMGPEVIEDVEEAAAEFWRAERQLKMAKEEREDAYMLLIDRMQSHDLSSYSSPDFQINLEEGKLKAKVVRKPKED